jgi:hypothetical protein
VMEVQRLGPLGRIHVVECAEEAVGILARHTEAGRPPPHASPLVGGSMPLTTLCTTLCVGLRVSLIISPSLMASMPQILWRLSCCPRSPCTIHLWDSLSFAA